MAIVDTRLICSAERLVSIISQPSRWPDRFFLRMSIIQSANRNVRNRVDNATVADASRAKSRLKTGVSGQNPTGQNPYGQNLTRQNPAIDTESRKRPQYPDSKTGFRASSEFVVRLTTGHRFRLEAVCYRTTAGGDMFDYNERDGPRKPSATVTPRWCRNQ